MNVFVFDIETIPDVVMGRKCLGITGASDADVVKAMQLAQFQQNGSEFIRHHCQQVVAISAVFRHRDTVRVWSLGDAGESEKSLIERFFSGIQKFIPMLVSWNGSGFDLPVLHYRALLHGVVASTYWETGEFDSHFRWNNYLNRFHSRHLDLMDVLSGYQNRAFAPLDEIALSLDLPGKMGMEGSKVWQAYQEGRLEDIRNYCETDVLNTYLIYLKFELMRGKLTADEYQDEQDKLRATLEQEAHPHFLQFLEAWPQK